MSTIDVKDASGATVPIEKPLAPSRAAAALSRPVVLSTEDKASLDAIGTLLTAQSVFLDGLETLITATNAALAAAIPAGTNTIGATLDAGPSWTSVWGVSGVPFTSADQHSAVASVTDVPTSGQKLCIDDLIFSTDTAMNVTFKEETSGTVVFGPWYLPANTTIQVTPRGKKKLPTANKKLQVITSVAGNITVQAGYHSEA